MNKKSQAQLIVNVVIGIILLVIIFVIFWWISSNLENMKYDSITDNQSLSVYDSYVLMLGQINGSELDTFVELMDELHDSEGYLGNKLMFDNYATFEKDITKYDKAVQGRSLESYVVVLGPNGELRSFEMYPLFFPLLRKTNCNVAIGDDEWLPMHRYRVGTSVNYKTNFCRIKAVLNE